MSRSTIQVLSNAIRASSRSQASCSDHQTVISSPFTGWLQLTQMPLGGQALRDRPVTPRRRL
jgi:hypothetical protein